MNKKMSINNRDKTLLFILLGAVVLFLVWRFVVTPMTERNAQLTTEANTLRQEIAELERIQQNEEAYRTDMANMNAEIETVFKDIPAGIKAEDKVVFTKNIESKYDLDVYGIGLQEDLLVYTMDEKGDNPTDEGKVLLSTNVTIDCNTSYEALKAVLRGIKNEGKKLSIASATFSFDRETGGLTGTLVANMFYLNGQGLEYVPDPIESVQIGTSNLFGSSGGGSSSGSSQQTQQNSDDDEEEDDSEADEAEE